MLVVYIIMTFPGLIFCFRIKENWMWTTAFCKRSWLAARMWINGFIKNHLTIVSISLNAYSWEGLKGIKIHNAVTYWWKQSSSEKK